jgi:hypothetical protein
MTRPTSFCVLACLALAIFVAYSQSTAVRGEQDKTAATHNGEKEIFKDQVVLIELLGAGDGSESVALTNAHIAKLGQREFIVGDGYATEDSDTDWLSDVTVSVPCDDVVRLQSMTTERNKEYLKMWKENSHT